MHPHPFDPPSVFSFRLMFWITTLDWPSVSKSLREDVAAWLRERCQNGLQVITGRLLFGEDVPIQPVGSEPLGHVIQFSGDTNYSDGIIAPVQLHEIAKELAVFIGRRLGVLSATVRIGRRESEEMVLIPPPDPPPEVVLPPES